MILLSWCATNSTERKWFIATLLLLRFEINPWHVWFPYLSSSVTEHTFFAILNKNSWFAKRNKGSKFKNWCIYHKFICAAYWFWPSWFECDFLTRTFSIFFKKRALWYINVVIKKFSQCDISHLRFAEETGRKSKHGFRETFRVPDLPEFTKHRRRYWFKVKVTSRKVLTIFFNFLFS